MAITVEGRTEIISLVVGMFGAAPGASVLSDLVAAKEAGSTIKQIATNLMNTTQFTGIFPTFLTNNEFATKVVNQLLVEASATAKADAVTVLTGELNGGMSRVDAFIAAINFVNSTDSTNASYGTSAAAFDNKVSVATYYSVEKQLSGDSLAALQNVIINVGSTSASVDTAKADVDGKVNVGQTFTLTTGIDGLTGLGGNDTFNASYTTAATDVFGGLDVIDGGAGNDTLNVASSAPAASFSFNNATIKNVENISVSTNGDFTGLNVSGIAGLTSFTGVAASTVATTLTAASTTDVTLNLGTTNNSTVTGGKAVSVTKGSTAAGTLGVTGSALTSVTAKGGTGAVTISNNTATTLKSVTLDGVDANTGITANGLTDVTLKGAVTAARTITVTNTTAGHALTVNAAGTGYNSTGATEFQTVVTDTVATSATVNTTAKSSLDLSGSTGVKTLTLTGSGALKLAATANAVTSIDGSAATGALTLGTLNANAVTVKTGSGADSLTVAATAATTVNTGAGNDTVTLGAAIAATSKIELGAGNDTLLAGTGSVATSSSTVIDGGDGDDSVSANLINAGNAGQFKNFEKINLDSTTGLDLALLTGNTISSLTMSGTSTTATYQNVKLANGLTVDFVGNNSGVTNTLSFSDATGSSDSYTITFAGVTTGTPGSANVRAGTVVTAGVENYNIVSGGTSAWNEITLGANSSAKTVTITGAAKLDLAFAATVGTAGASTGVTSVDGSAATGALSINTTNLGVNTGSTGLTVKGGSAADTITLAQKATVDAGAGNDTVVVSASGGTITTGAGTDTVDVKGAATGSTTAPVITVITDFTVGTDKIQFKDQGTETFTATKVNVNTATALFSGTTNALDLAAAGNGGTNAAVTWFQYAGDTYIVQDLGAGATFTTTDIVVKLTGLVDLSGLTVADFTFA